MVGQTFRSTASARDLAPAQQPQLDQPQAIADREADGAQNDQASVKIGTAERPLRLHDVLPEPRQRGLHLDHDGEPEILIDYYTGGAHCCVYTLIHRYNPDRQTYEAIAFPTTHIGYELKDLNKDGIPEFVTADGGFAYAFSSFAGSGFPLKIWNYQNGKMVDVTKQYPTLVRNNAYRYWIHAQTIIRTQGDRESKGLLAAYLADKYTLGEKKDGWKNLRALYKSDDRIAFFESLEKFLKESSYDR